MNGQEDAFHGSLYFGNYFYLKPYFVIRQLYKLYHPEIFQGKRSKEKYFEGWYYKLVSERQDHAIAIIPGVALYDDTDRHAFIQLINGITQHTSYYKFPIEDFSADEKVLHISIAGNSFSTEMISLDMPEIRGEIKLVRTTPLRKSLFNPGIMGWYSFTPRMQCYHGIVSLHHQLEGETSGNIGNISWSGGKGYLEKDWGTSFPKCWIWTHSNHFDVSPEASLMASVAHIPWMGAYFPGFIVVLWIDGKEYRFATYNGSRMKCTVSNDHVFMDFKRKELQLSIKAFKGPTAVLRSPITGQMTGKVNESLQARLEVSLLNAGREVWAANGTTAGLEVAGDTSILESEVWRR